MIASLEAAAHEAALEDGVLTGYSQNRNDDLFKTKKAGLRRGKWTTEEESYANRLIYEFKLGLLPLTDGTTLRTFLSKLLNCDPMRISKKFVGQNCIGKQVFRRRQQDLDKLSIEQIERSRKELSELERKFLERVAQTNRTRSAPKEGRMAGYDEEGGLAPWMVQPEESEHVIPNNPVSNNYASTMPGQIVMQQRIQPQQMTHFPPTGQYQNYNNADYMNGYNPNSQKFLKQNDNARLSNENGSVVKTKDNFAKVKPGKLTSSLYGGDKEQIYGDHSKFTHYYDGSHNKLNNGVNPPLQTNKNETNPIEDPNNINRINSLEMLCSLDMVKFSQNQSLDHLPNFALQSSNQIPSTFPWYGGSNPNATAGDPNGNHLNNNFDDSMKQSASAVSLSDFAMSLWPSMNNLVTAAEAALSSNSVDHNHMNVSSDHGNKNQFKSSSEEFQKNGTNTLGSLSKLQSLSNVALDELEALSTMDEAKSKNVRPVITDNNKTITVASAPCVVPKPEFEVVKPDVIKDSSSDVNPAVVVHPAIPKPNVKLEKVVPPNDAVVLSTNTNNSSSSSSSSDKVVIRPTAGGNAVISAANIRLPPDLITNGFSSALLPNQLRHNSSVENFWMLVNMGDLPQPDNDVLSETLWPNTMAHQNHSTAEGDDKTVKSHHSQSSHGSKKRHFGESVNNKNNMGYKLESHEQFKGDSNKLLTTVSDSVDPKLKKKALQVAFKNEYILNHDTLAGIENSNYDSPGEDKAVSQLPFSKPPRDTYNIVDSNKPDYNGNNTENGMFAT